MKHTRIAIAAILLALQAPIITSCSSVSSGRVATVQTLKAVGYTAAAIMETAAKLRVEGRISAEQWQKIADFHDNKYLPVYRLAIATVATDLTAPAPQEVLNVLQQLNALVISFQ